MYTATKVSEARKNVAFSLKLQTWSMDGEQKSLEMGWVSMDKI